MIQHDMELAMPGGPSDCVLLQPEQHGRWPGVMYLTDIGGIRPAQIEVAKRIAAEGYAVLMPNLFYRTSRPPVIVLQPDAPKEARMKRFAELAAPLTPEVLERDAAAYLDFFDLQDCVSKDHPLGVVGYCYSGGVALRFAACQPDRIAACASFHGGRLFTDSPASPHRLLPRVKARLYLGHAVNDSSMPAEAIENLEQALAAWGGEYKSETYEGAYHSWTTPDSPVYNPAQAERAFGKLKALFAETLHRNA